MWQKSPARLFTCFPHHSVQQGFIWIQVTGRLIENNLVIGVFFDQEKAVFAFDDGGDRDVGLPNHELFPCG